MNQEMIAQQFSDALITDTRADGSEFVRRADDSPLWIVDVLHAAHGGMMPDDLRYKMIRECADCLTEYDPEQWEESTHEIADRLVDVYNNARLQWLASNLARAAYVDEARDEGLIGAESGIFEQLGIGQYCEYLEILQSLIESINEQSEETA